MNNSSPKPQKNVSLARKGQPLRGTTSSARKGGQQSLSDTARTSTPPPPSNKMEKDEEAASAAAGIAKKKDLSPPPKLTSTEQHLNDTSNMLDALDQQQIRGNVVQLHHAATQGSDQSDQTIRLATAKIAALKGVATSLVDALDHQDVTAKDGYTHELQHQLDQKSLKILSSQARHDQMKERFSQNYASHHHEITDILQGDAVHNLAGGISGKTEAEEEADEQRRMDELRRRIKENLRATMNFDKQGGIRGTQRGTAKVGEDGVLHFERRSPILEAYKRAMEAEQRIHEERIEACENDRPLQCTKAMQKQQRTLELEKIIEDADHPANLVPVIWQLAESLHTAETNLLHSRLHTERLSLRFRFFHEELLTMKSEVAAGVLGDIQHWKNELAIFDDEKEWLYHKAKLLSLQAGGEDTTQAQAQYTTKLEESNSKSRSQNILLRVNIQKQRRMRQGLLRRISVVECQAMAAHDTLGHEQRHLDIMRSKYLASLATSHVAPDALAGKADDLEALISVRRHYLIKNAIILRVSLERMASQKDEFVRDIVKKSGVLRTTEGMRNDYINFLEEGHGAMLQSYSDLYTSLVEDMSPFIDHDLATKWTNQEDPVCAKLAERLTLPNPYSLYVATSQVLRDNWDNVKETFVLAGKNLFAKFTEALKEIDEGKEREHDLAEEVRAQNQKITELMGEITQSKRAIRELVEQGLKGSDLMNAALELDQTFDEVPEAETIIDVRDLVATDAELNKLAGRYNDLVGKMNSVQSAQREKNNKLKTLESRVRLAWEEKENLNSTVADLKAQLAAGAGGGGNRSKEKKGTSFVPGLSGGIKKAAKKPAGSSPVPEKGGGNLERRNSARSSDDGDTESVAPSISASVAAAKSEADAKERLGKVPTVKSGSTSTSVAGKSRPPPSTRASPKPQPTASVSGGADAVDPLAGTQRSQSSLPPGRSLNQTQTFPLKGVSEPPQAGGGGPGLVDALPVDETLDVQLDDADLDAGDGSHPALTAEALEAMLNKPPPLVMDSGTVDEENGGDHAEDVAPVHGDGTSKEEGKKGEGAKSVASSMDLDATRMTPKGSKKDHKKGHKPPTPTNAAGGGKKNTPRALPRPVVETAVVECQTDKVLIVNEETQELRPRLASMELEVGSDTPLPRFKDSTAQSAPMPSRQVAERSCQAGVLGEEASRPSQTDLKQDDIQLKVATEEKETEILVNDLESAVEILRESFLRVCQQSGVAVEINMSHHGSSKRTATGFAMGSSRLGGRVGSFVGGTGGADQLRGGAGEEGGGAGDGSPPSAVMTAKTNVDFFTSLEQMNETIGKMENAASTALGHSIHVPGVGATSGGTSPPSDGGAMSERGPLQRTSSTPFILHSPLPSSSNEHPLVDSTRPLAISALDTAGSNSGSFGRPPLNPTPHQQQPHKPSVLAVGVQCNLGATSPVSTQPSTSPNSSTGGVARPACLTTGSQTELLGGWTATDVAAGGAHRLLTSATRSRPGTGGLSRPGTGGTGRPGTGGGVRPGSGFQTSLSRISSAGMRSTDEEVAGEMVLDSSSSDDEDVLRSTIKSIVNSTPGTRSSSAATTIRSARLSSMGAEVGELGYELIDEEATADGGDTAPPLVGALTPGKARRPRNKKPKFEEPTAGGNHNTIPGKVRHGKSGIQAVLGQKAGKQDREGEQRQPELTQEEIFQQLFIGGRPAVSASAGALAPIRLADSITTVHREQYAQLALHVVGLHRSLGKLFRSIGSMLGLTSIVYTEPSMASHVYNGIRRAAAIEEQRLSREERRLKREQNRSLGVTSEHGGAQDADDADLDAELKAETEEELLSLQAVGDFALEACSVDRSLTRKVKQAVQDKWRKMLLQEETSGLGYGKGPNVKMMIQQAMGESAAAASRATAAISSHNNQNPHSGLGPLSSIPMLREDDQEVQADKMMSHHRALSAKTQKNLLLADPTGGGTLKPQSSPILDRQSLMTMREGGASFSSYGPGGLTSPERSPLPQLGGTPPPQSRPGTVESNIPHPRAMTPGGTFSRPPSGTSKSITVKSQTPELRPTTASAVLFHHRGSTAGGGSGGPASPPPPGKVVVSRASASHLNRKHHQPPPGPSNAKGSTTLNPGARKDSGQKPPSGGGRRSTTSRKKETLGTDGNSVDVP